MILTSAILAVAVAATSASPAAPVDNLRAMIDEKTGLVAGDLCFRCGCRSGEIHFQFLGVTVDSPVVVTALCPGDESCGDEDSRVAADAETAAQLAFGIRRISATNTWPIAFELTLPTQDPVDMKLFDVAGRRVWNDMLEPLRTGIHRATISGDRLRPSVYWLAASQAGVRARLTVVVLR
jgi:hypothetical protein